MKIYVPPRTVRRILIPVGVVVELTILLACVFAATIGIVAWPVTSRRRVLRVACFGCLYLTIELAVLTTCGWYWLRHAARRLSVPHWDQLHADLLDWALAVIVRAADGLLGFRLQLTEPPDTDALDCDHPVLVLARHAGPGDSVAVAHLLLGRYRRQVRIALKDTLALDPALDVLLTRLKCVFVSSVRSAGTTALLAEAVGAMTGRDALLLFPEGGNWTRERRVRYIDRLRQRRDGSKAHIAEQFEYLLPPRSAGVLACLTNRPDLEVVFVAHTGLEELVSFRDVWAHLPFEIPISLRWWKAGGRPRLQDAGAVDNWLITEWAIIEQWIGTEADLGHRLPPT